ncbi:MAG TPA: aminotransferase class III-fold pyridoxal phosphate-dependent enzyme, partial [Candidatus Limnocylindria bacterium]|nr:aminotransferase class III-fold pyridoxal phosphate-dependent enzyme [Candidatus Limnocylindria bacterium]
FPVGAFGGRADIMKKVLPAGPVFQAGTLSGNPVAMAAGAATLDLLTDATYARLEESAARLADGLAEAARAARATVRIGWVASLLTAFLDEGTYPVFFHAMLQAGFLLPPSQHEAWFVSSAHTDADLDATLRAARDAFAVAAAAGRER